MKFHCLYLFPLGVWFAVLISSIKLFYAVLLLPTSDYIDTHYPGPVPPGPTTTKSIWSFLHSRFGKSPNSSTKSTRPALFRRHGRSLTKRGHSNLSSIYSSTIHARPFGSAQVWENCLPPAARRPVSFAHCPFPFPASRSQRAKLSQIEQPVKAIKITFMGL